MIHEANILSNLGRKQEAYEVLLSITKRVLDSSDPIKHRDYYRVKAQVSMNLGRYLEASDCCIKAIGINNELGRSSHQQ